jgi:hypothetical protein
MSNRLGGKQGTAYLGTNANQPPNWSFNDRDPNQFDVNNVSLGDLWLNQTNEGVWVLVSLAGDPTSKGSLATWAKIESAGIGVLDQLTGNTGGAITPDGASNINIVSGIPGLSIDGNPGTHTLTLNSTIGGDVVQTATGNTGGPVSPVLGNINIVGDNVGIAITGNPGTHTLVASLIGGGDAAEHFPTDSGTANAFGGVLNINTGNSTQNAGSSVLFSGAGDTVKFNVTDANGNTLIGLLAGNAAVTGTDNTALGDGAGRGLTSGAGNIIIGEAAGFNLTTGSDNVFVGQGAGDNITTGGNNTCLGRRAGHNYTIGDSSNICIGDGTSGTLGESHVLHIGSGTGGASGQLQKSFIHGIRGVTPDTADGIPMFIGSAGQLGTVGSGGSTFVSTVTGNSGGAVSPNAGNINIVGDGVTANVVGTPGSHTLTITAVGGGGGTLNDLIGDDSIPVLPAAGAINVIANQAAQNCGSSVSFTGAVANTLTLNVTDGNNNTIIGFGSGNATLTGTNNTIIGDGNASAFTTASSNTIIGEGSGNSLTTGVENILIGVGAGSTYTTAESNNIAISSTGVILDANVLRIGQSTGAGAHQLEKAFIHGIQGVTPDTTDGIPVFIGSAGQLGTVGTGGSTLVSSLTGNSGGAVFPLAGNIIIEGDGVTANVVGTPGSHKLTITAVGGGGGALNDLIGDDSIPVVPAAGAINVLADNAVQNCGSTVRFTGTVANTLLLNVTDSNNNTMIGFQTGNATSTGTNNTALGDECASALTTSSHNIFIGKQTGSLITTGSGNFLCGDASLNIVLKGTTTSSGLYAFGAGNSGTLFLHNWGGVSSGNTFLGYASGSSFNAGQQGSNLNNTGCGQNNLVSLTTGAANTTIGVAAGASITSGSNNTLIGVGAGLNYTSSESSNICIGSGAGGTVGESHVLQIGGAGTGTGPGQINKTFIAAIRGVTTGVLDALPVVIDSNGQLGTAGGVSFINTVTGNTGGPVSASAGNINIVGDGTSINIVGNPGLNTLTVSAIGGSSGPSFLAYLTNEATVTPNVYAKVSLDTVSYNLGGAFNIGTSIFTAPVTGIYNFSGGVGYSFGASVTPQGYITIVTTSQTYVLTLSSFAALKWSAVGRTVQAVFSGNIYATMTAGDTAFMAAFSTQGTPLIITGTASTGAIGIDTFFSGSLV